MTKEDFYLDYLTTHGMNHAEAVRAIELDKIVSVDSARRAYNEIKEVKNKAKEEEKRKEFSPEERHRKRMQNITNQLLV